eukprot:2007600-Rhodomonas_salina.1
MKNKIKFLLSFSHQPQKLFLEHFSSVSQNRPKLTQSENEQAGDRSASTRSELEPGRIPRIAGTSFLYAAPGASTWQKSDSSTEISKGYHNVSSLGVSMQHSPTALDRHCKSVAHVEAKLMPAWNRHIK